MLRAATTKPYLLLTRIKKEIQKDTCFASVLLEPLESHRSVDNSNSALVLGCIAQQALKPSRTARRSFCQIFSSCPFKSQSGIIRYRVEFVYRRRRRVLAAAGGSWYGRAGTFCVLHPHPSSVLITPPPSASVRLTTVRYVLLDCQPLATFALLPVLPCSTRGQALSLALCCCE